MYAPLSGSTGFVRIADAKVGSCRDQMKMIKTHMTSPVTGSIHIPPATKGRGSAGTPYKNESSFHKSKDPRSLRAHLHGSGSHSWCRDPKDRPFTPSTGEKLVERPSSTAIDLSH